MIGVSGIELYGSVPDMADDNDILDSFLDEDLDVDIPIVVGGKRRLMQGGQIVDAQNASTTSKNDDKAATADDSKPVTTEAGEQKPEPPAGDYDVAAQYAEDEKEMQKGAENELPENVAAKDFSKADRRMDDLTDEAEAACSAQFSDDENMRSRFKMLVETFFKDLRDSLETKSKLTMPTSSGGMGLTEEQADKVMKTLTSKRKEFVGMFAERTQEEKKKYVAEAADKQLHERDRADQRDKEQLDKLYKKRGGESVQAETGKKSSPAVLTKVVKVEGAKKSSASVPAPEPTDEANDKSDKPQVEEAELANALKAFFEQDKKQDQAKGDSAKTEDVPVKTNDNKQKSEKFKDALPTYSESSRAMGQQKKPAELKTEPAPPSPAKPNDEPPANLPVDEPPISYDKPLTPPPVESKLEPARDSLPTSQKSTASEMPTYSGQKADDRLMPSVTSSKAPIPAPSATEDIPKPAKPNQATPEEKKSQDPTKPESQQNINGSKKPPTPKRPEKFASPVTPKMPIRPQSLKAPAPTAPPAPNKPLMSDVQTAPRLLGPVEELRSITLKDFRRFSKDPKEATLKIKDKIDLLGEEQSFEAKTAGIKAWRESPTHKLYLELLRRSLEGKPINTVIKEMEEAGEDTLDKAEFDAIMKLNREIRFG